MADADEDVIPAPGLAAEDTDISDEVQDFRFLSILSRDDAKIPKRGEKDFEPHNTNLQLNTLDASRQAMHDAISFQRSHPPKRSNLAVYHPPSNMAYIDAPKSTLFKSMGVVHSPKNDPLNAVRPNLNRLWLLPEEIVYLIERGTVDCRWPTPGEADDGDDPSHLLPMSVQGAHAVFLGLASDHADGLTFERYTVYSYLKRAGYSVHRAPTWERPAAELDPSSWPPRHPASWVSMLGLTSSSWRNWLYADDPLLPAHGPLVGKRRFRSYPDIYRSLSLIPFYNPSTTSPRPPPSKADSPRITYNVWKPNNQSYKKSRPGPPDFRIAVLDARQTTLPTLAELSALMDTAPYQPPPPRDGSQLYARLKHGYKSVILAVVDQGVASFVRLADAAFGLEPIFDRQARAGGGGKGRPRGGNGGRKR